MSRQYWILDPAGHRNEWASNLPEDGAVVEEGPFKGAAHIVLPPPDDPEDWVCDYCNEIILTVWGGEPFPVPSDGSYALCAVDYAKVRGGRLWPATFCACGACVAQAERWHPQLWKAYRSLAKEVIAQN